MLVILACLVGSWAGLASAAGDEAPQRISAKDALTLRTLVGRQVTVFGRVIGTNVSDRSGHHFLNFENSELSVICFASDLDSFSSSRPAERYRSRDIEITGLLERYNPDQNAWEPLAEKPTPVGDVGAVVIGGKMRVTRIQSINARRIQKAM